MASLMSPCATWMAGSTCLQMSPASGIFDIEGSLGPAGAITVNDALEKLHQSGEVFPQSWPVCVVSGIV